MANVLCVVGTRPETIKMAPVIRALQAEPWASLRVLATAQHREMLDQVLSLFAIRADLDLDIMRPNQTLAALTARLITKLDEVLLEEKPDVVLAEGDTTTVMAAALVSYYRNVAFGHVEAGLRTGDLQNPFPEEMNRIVAGHLARWHFAPTQRARQSLLREGITDQDIYVTGNPVIDALLDIAPMASAIGVKIPRHERLLLVTAHRRESFGVPLGNIIQALRDIARRNPDVHILYPVHPNPNVHEPVHRELSHQPRITLCEPLDYLPFVAAMKAAYLILTDSGGVQEEAPALAKPVLVLRNETERPEAIEAGVVRLVGTEHERIVVETERLLRDEQEYKCMAKGVSPYGDGHAAKRIVQVLRQAYA
jgi:UDP-N-acetylglucosamine 2-epimerase (non-hydrolysing)